MMLGPGDERAAGAAGDAGHGHFRASDADREQVIDTLKAAFVQGRLTLEELGLRVGQAVASRTYAELAAVIADIPPAAAAPEPPRAPGRARKPVNKAKVAVWTFVAVMIVLAIAAFLADREPDGIIAVWAASVAAGTMIADTWDRRRSRRQLPPGPSADAAGQATQRPAPVTDAGPVRQVDQAPPDTAPVAPRRRSRPHPPGWRVALPTWPNT